MATSASDTFGDNRYRATLDSIMEGCQLIGFDWTYLYLNDAADKHNRRPKSELLGHTMMEMWPGIEATPVFRMLRRCMEERVALHQEIEFEFPDRSKGWFDVRSQPVPEGIFVLSIDISDRREAESRIRQLNRVYAVLSDINHTIVRESDSSRMLTRACCVTVEKGNFKMAWVGLLDPTSRKLNIVAHAGADPETLRILASMMEGESSIGCAFTRGALQMGRLSHCNDIASDSLAGNWRDAALQRGLRSMAAFPLISRGKVAGVLNLYAGEPEFFDENELRLLEELSMDISFALDVHEREVLRQRAELELRVSEERFRQVVENIHEVFWVTDPAKNQVLYISPAYEAVWGRTCASLYAAPRSWLDAIHPEDQERVLRAAESRQASGEYDETYRVIRPDGTVRWIRDRAFPIRNAAGEVYRIVGTAEDISANRNLEEQLRQSQKIESIGLLAGGIAHDFNNLLTIINGRSQMILGRLSPSDKMYADLELICNTGERAAGLTRQLLAFSRQQVLEPKILNLNTIVAAMEKMLRRIVPESITLATHPDPELHRVKTDPGQIEQVILNLVVNARDAMPHGGTMKIETANAQLSADYCRDYPGFAPGPYVMLAVSDTGHGMDAETKARIFEPFFTTKDHGRGTGLGLSTVFGIVKQSLGHIDVASDVGQGSTFKIFLPQSEESPASATSGSHKAMQTGKEVILVVEDESGVRELVRDLLEMNGYVVLQAQDGLDALKLCEEYAGVLNLVLTDVVMPRMGGPELVKRLKALRPELKFLYTSGYTENAEIRNTEEDSGIELLQKPFSPFSLARKVREVLDKA